MPEEITMQLITRDQWGARATRGSSNLIAPHPLGVAVHYSETNVGAAAHDTCAALVREIQDFHMDSRGWADIAYNFLVCQHGFVFEGRGTTRGSAANGTTHANYDYFAVCGLIGTTDTPAPELLAAIGDGIGLCRTAGAGDQVVGHRDLYATACPGAALYALVLAGHWNGTPPQAPAPVAYNPGHTPAPAPVAPVQLVVDGIFGPATKRRLQQWAHVAQDGILGPITWAAVQRLVGTTPDGLPGPITWRAIQRLTGAAQDGIPGPDTYRHLQAYLNTH